ncbi:hypothetical protein GCM10011359_13390 [Nesterenkonia alkaliphila]|nr:hypothetical protein GCM10011359_13390 [Nesterenkonia alkaliphila]
MPDDADPRRKYCSASCRKRAEVRRRRARLRGSETTDLRAELVGAYQRLQHLETQLGQAHARVEDREATIRDLRTQLARQERMWVKSSRARARTVLEARDRVAAVTAELASATEGTVDRSHLTRAAERIVDLQHRMNELSGQYDRLVTEHRSLADRYEAMSTDYQALVDIARTLHGDRKRYQTVVEQWNVLAGRLAQQLTGQRGSKIDRTIVATWANWRKELTEAGARPDRSGDRTKGGAR